MVDFGFGWVLTRGLLFVYCRWYNNTYDRLFQPKRYKLLHILISDNIQISHEYVLYSCICACHVQILILMWLLGDIYLFYQYFEFKIIDASTKYEILIMAKILKSSDGMRAIKNITTPS